MLSCGRTLSRIREHKLMASGSLLLPPGFRFHPTDEELILHYLRKRTASPFCPESPFCLASIIADVDIYKFNPWDLPDKAIFGEREWYFFSPRDRKYPNGVRPNRAAASGYWKATGTDKHITASSGSECIGIKKALVFYKGKPPMGVKTNWIMHEFRLPESRCSQVAVRNRENRMRLDDWVLCRIYQKTSHQQSAGDQEHEEATVEDTMAKKSSLSFSDVRIIDEDDFSLLPSLLETPLIATIPEQATLLSTASSSSKDAEGNGYKLERVAANCWLSEWGGYYLNSSVKQADSSSHIYDQFLNPLEQPFFYQPPIFNFPMEKP